MVYFVILKNLIKNIKNYYPVQERPVLFKNSAPKKRFIFFFIPYAYPALKFLMDKTNLNLNLSITLLVFLMFSYFVLIKTKNLRNVNVKVLILPSHKLVAIFNIVAILILIK